MGQSSLDAHFRRTQLPGFLRLSSNLFKSQEVRVSLARSTAESAKLASYETDICEIKIAIYNVRNEIATLLVAVCPQQPATRASHRHRRRPNADIPRVKVLHHLAIPERARATRALTGQFARRPATIPGKGSLPTPLEIRLSPRLLLKRLSKQVSCGGPQQLARASGTRLIFKPTNDTGRNTR